MDLTPRLEPGRQRIQSYGSGGFRISGESHAGSVIVTPHRVTAWPRNAADHASIEDFAELLEADPAVEILLLGCGPRAIPPTPALREDLRKYGVGLDFMATGAACRTFNVLVEEDRRVAAALIAIA